MLINLQAMAMNIFHKITEFKEKSRILSPVQQVELQRQIWRNPFFFFAFGFGTGASRYFPGTVGTLAALPIYFLIMNQPLWLYIGIMVLLFLFAVYCSQQVVKLINVKDYSGIVCDEIIGFLVTMSVVTKPTWWLVILGFVLFRIFDMTKLWPIGWLDKHLPGGWGVVVDDIMAGIYAAICLYLFCLML